MKAKPPSIDELLQQLKHDKQVLHASTRAYKQKIKEKLRSPLALVTAVLGGIGLSAFAFSKKKSNNKVGRNNEAATDKIPSPVTGLIVAIVSSVLPKLLEQLGSQRK